MSQCPYSYFEYDVQAGDTLSSLAKKFSVSEKILKDSNAGMQIAQGAKVKVPCPYGGCGRGAFYAVKKGDTLYQIARRNGLTVDRLLEANPYLNPSYYIPGQIIIIPAAKPKNSPRQYTLGENEGLFDVLRKFDMDITTFCLLNPEIGPMDVKSGQRVNIAPKKQNTASGKWYTIGKDEDLVAVAARHGVKVSTLLGANENLRPSEFVAGVKVRIPDK